MNAEHLHQILYLSSKEVTSIYQTLDSVAIIREAFQLHGTQQTVLPDEAYLGWENPQGERVRSLNMPAYLGGHLQMAGTKIINSNIANPTRDLPRAAGVTLLFEPTAVYPMCIMEGASISSLRTASVTLLAAEILQGRAIESVCVIGAGVLARAHIELLVKRRKHFPALRTIHLFDIAVDRATSFAQALAPILRDSDIELQVAPQVEMAVRSAQLIIPVTTTTTGYIPYAWLQPGALLVNVSLDDALPDVVFRADQVIVDDWNLVKNGALRLLGRMYQAGQLSGPDDVIPQPVAGPHRRVDAQLGEIISGQKKGRLNEQEIILFNPFGLAIEDIALATYIYREAVRQNLGIWLDR